MCWEAVTGNSRVRGVSTWRTRSEAANENREALQYSGHYDSQSQNFPPTPLNSKDFARTYLSREELFTYVCVCMCAVGQLLV